MSQTPEQHRARRRRSGGLMMAAGIVLLFVSTFAVPEALVLLARASANGTALGDRAVAATVVGLVTLLGGGALAVVGFNRRRSVGEDPHPEDLLVDEQFGDGPVRLYDPDELRRWPSDGDRDSRED